MEHIKSVYRIQIKGSISLSFLVTLTRRRRILIKCYPNKTGNFSYNITLKRFRVTIVAVEKQ
jgi:hypothetical protein